MLARTRSAAVSGIDAEPVEIEVNVTGKGAAAGGETCVSIVGLPDAAVRESRDRVRSALESSGLLHPRGFVVVNLAPADLRKEGAAFDLGIALGMLAATGTVDREALAKCAVFGELSLNGTVRPVRGALPCAARIGGDPAIERILVPRANAGEAALAVSRRIVYPVDNIVQAVEILKGGGAPCTVSLDDYFAAPMAAGPDFADVKGQARGKRMLEIVAAGGHHSLLIGPPGCGKSMLAMRLPGILPPLTLAEALETSRIHSVAGLLSAEEPLVRRRPFRNPHHTISDVGLIGGGRDPRPGEISLAHNGVLFMDEFPEFKRNVLEVLRQPLENGNITVSRASGSHLFPARFMLCAAMNPCPCGRGAVELGCRCSALEKQRYRKRISGPILDRIDLMVELRQLTPDELVKAPEGESSAAVRERVCAAREIQQRRFRESGCFCNARMSPREMRRCCAIDVRGEQLLRQAIARFQLSPRAYDRILKVARTIADLAGSESIREEHLLEAVSYRESGL